MEQAVTVQTLNPQRFLPSPRRHFGELLIQVAPDHHADDLFFGHIGKIDRGDVLAISQDGAAVTDLEHLVHVMRDEDH